MTESVLSGRVDQRPGGQKDFREGFVPLYPSLLMIVLHDSALPFFLKERRK